MNYWLRPFSGRSWQTFIRSGSRTVAFGETHREQAQRVEIGDLFICYLLRLKRWVGLLEVTSTCQGAESIADCDEGRPLRFEVKPIVALPVEHGVPMESLEGKLSFYRPGGKPGQWIARVRRSLTRYDPSDATALSQAVRAAAADPVMRPYDPRKLQPAPRLHRIQGTDPQAPAAAVVAIPSGEQDEHNDPGPENAGPTHTEIQWRLLDVGAGIGMNVWAPKSDRGRSWQHHRIRDAPSLLDELPPLFNVNPPLRETIENIDVLWLKDGSILAAFEVEHTTRIYSGLLRMADLVAMCPMIKIKLYLVAPDDRFERFMRQIARPTFASRDPPLHTLCRFLPYSTMCQRLDDGKDLIRFLQPEFLDDIAEMYDPAEEVEE